MAQDEELERIRRKKMYALLNRYDDRTVNVKIFDLLLPNSCGPGGCGPGGCGPSFTSENMRELNSLAYQLVEKYGRDRFRFELISILDDAIRDYKEVLQLLQERKDDALPIILIGSQVKFIGNIPSLEEFEEMLGW